jgi:uracil-DNA glycosylase
MNYQQPPPEPAQAPRTHPWWRIVAWSAAIVLVLGGLAIVAFLVFAVSAANSYGSNK